MSGHGNREKLDELVGAFFAGFDNRGDSIPELNRMVGCFTEKAVIVCHSRVDTAIYTPLEFALPRIELLTRGGLRDFHEFETSAITSIFGGIAVRTSRYGKSGMLNGSNYSGTGTKCFQFVELAGAWRISALAWTDDDA